MYADMPVEPRRVRVERIHDGECVQDGCSHARVGLRDSEEKAFLGSIEKLRREAKKVLDGYNSASSDRDEGPDHRGLTSLYRVKNRLTTEDMDALGNAGWSIVSSWIDKITTTPTRGLYVFVEGVSFRMARGRHRLIVTADIPVRIPEAYITISTPTTRARRSLTSRPRRESCGCSGSCP
ncbi:hypothetical protein LA080_007214 [Diaporthe eres]|nr:hypothetical protein LA080_007214 [Diaporthe eres]